MLINTLWVFLIIGHDIVHKKVNYKNKRMFFMLLFLAIATIGWLISLPSHGFYFAYLHELVKLYEFGYIFYSDRESAVKALKHTKKLNELISKAIAYETKKYIEDNFIEVKKLIFGEPAEFSIDRSQ